MKMKMTSIMILPLLLTACVNPVEQSCGYQKNYCSPYDNNSNCGPRITYRCDPICDTCKAAEKSCERCWRCINSDGCMNDIPR